MERSKQNKEWEPDAEILAAYATGDLAADAVAAVDEMLAASPDARRILAAIRHADQSLRSLTPATPSDDAVLRIRRALAEECEKRPTDPEIMTLEETARYLRLSSAELESVLEQLPVFEISGRLRIRKSRLEEWLTKRERQYQTGLIDSDVGRIISGITWKGAAG